jgi:iron complex outermembrane recepter protein
LDAAKLASYQVLVTTGVRILDILRGETVDVAQIYGGNPALLPEKVKTKQIALTLRPSLNIMLNAEYAATNNRNLISGFPRESVPIWLAFPERFTRDQNGQLTAVDVRPLNFSRRSEERLRYGFNLNLPLGGDTKPVGTAPAPQPVSEQGTEASTPAPMPMTTSTRLQLSANHTLYLSNKIVIRPGTPAVDLLGGGAIGIGGGRTRHQVDFSVGLSTKGIGARATGVYRGENLLQVRSGAGIDTLRFAPVTTFNLTAFAEANRFFPQAGWLKGTRISIAALNLSDARQRVVDSAGITPLRYQPGYREPIGRSIELEIRKQF